MSKDLRTATVFWRPLHTSSQHSAQELQCGLERLAGALRVQVAARMRLKYAPELRFQKDPVFDRAVEMRAKYLEMLRRTGAST